jgi:polyisoprenoid-binding protein YceI
MTSTNEAAADLSPYAGSWTLEPGQTSVEFHTKALWLLNVVGTFNATEGGAVVGDDGSVAATFVLDAASVDTKNKKRDDHLRTADFFEVGAFPTISFTVTGARPKGAGKVEMTGTLTIHGVTRPLTLLAETSVTDGAATVLTELDIDRSAWGLTWAKLGAGLKNHVVIKAHFTKA